jgi:hypothetical protein
MSHFHIRMRLAATAALAAAIGVAGAPAYFALTVNAHTDDELTPTDSKLDELKEGTLAPGVPVAFEPKPIPPGQEDWKARSGAALDAHGAAPIF